MQKLQVPFEHRGLDFLVRVSREYSSDEVLPGISDSRLGLSIFCQLLVIDMLRGTLLIPKLTTCLPWV